MHPGARNRSSCDQNRSTSANSSRRNSATLLRSWQETASSEDDDVKFIAAVTPRGPGPTTPARRAPVGSASRLRPPSVSNGLTSAHRREELTPSHLSVAADAAAPKQFTVFCAPTAGSLFTEMLAVLLRREGHQWSPTTLPDEGRKASARVRADAPAACCNRLSGINLFLGEKLVAEKLIEDARTVALRVLRGQSECFTTCPHERWRNDHLPPSYSRRCLVNYYAGLRSITLKSKMVKTLLQYHRSWKELGKYLPRTHTMIPRGGSRSAPDEREELVNAMCADNVEEFRKYRAEAGHWIAKPSHGAHGSDIKIFFANQKGLDELVTFIDSREDQYSWVVSRYISRPLLYQGRKFDLRCWVLVDTTYQIYLHDELVMRTSSEEYDISNITTDSITGRLANITNHCVQAEGLKYSLHEDGNELWKDTLAKLVADTSKALVASGECRSSLTLTSHVIPQIEYIVASSLLAAAATMQPPVPSDPTRYFQVLGYDFILDERLNVWLLEINGAPGVAAKLLKQVVYDVLEIVVDPVFPSQLNGSPLRMRKQSGLAMNGFRKTFPKKSD